MRSIESGLHTMPVVREGLIGAERDGITKKLWWSSVAVKVGGGQLRWKRQGRSHPANPEAAGPTCRGRYFFLERMRRHFHPSLTTPTLGSTLH